MADIVDLAEWKKRKETGENAPPLYVNHSTGKVTGSPTPISPKKPEYDFGDRLQRVRSSLEKINRLMADLRQMSRDDDWRHNPPAE